QGARDGGLPRRGGAGATDGLDSHARRLGRRRLARAARSPPDRRRGGGRAAGPLRGSGRRVRQARHRTGARTLATAPDVHPPRRSEGRSRPAAWACPVPFPAMSMNPHNNPAPDHEILDVFEKRYSPYLYEPRAVETEKIRRCLEAARWAPSSYNEQPWSFILARREEPDEFAKI